MLRILVTIFLFWTFLFGASQVEILTQKAKSGNAEAIYQLGYLYENGIDVSVDRTKAISLYKKAAEMGSEDAQLSLALMRLNKSMKKSISLSNKVIVKGKGAQLDSALSSVDLKEIVKGAKNGDKESLFMLAVMYDNGIAPLPQDSQKAKIFYKKAAKAGSKKAIEVLNLSRSFEK